METQLELIRQALNRDDIEGAREMLRAELRLHPSAEAYYLAAQVALAAAQRREFLEKALALDPFHERAYGQLAAIKASDAVSVTKENLAPISMRFTAYLIDAFIIYVVVWTIQFILSTYGIIPPPDPRSYVRLNARQGYYPSQLLFNGLVNLTVSCLYNAYFLTQQNGQTPGKYLRKIRVVSLNGEKLTYGQALIRNELGYFLSTMFFFIGFLWAFSNEKRQTWHDMLAKTVVVRKYPNR